MKWPVRGKISLTIHVTRSPSDDYRGPVKVSKSPYAMNPYSTQAMIVGVPSRSKSNFVSIIVRGCYYYNSKQKGKDVL